jgi:hypothetical protein
VAYEAMFIDSPVSEFTQGTSPITVFGSEGERIEGQKYPDNVTMACVIDLGR